MIQSRYLTFFEIQYVGRHTSCWIFSDEWIWHVHVLPWWLSISWANLVQISRVIAENDPHLFPAFTAQKSELWRSRPNPNATFKPKIVGGRSPFSFPSLSLPSLPLPSAPFPCPPLFYPPLRSRPLKCSYRVLGERCKLHKRGLGRSPSRNRIWCILAMAVSFSHFVHIQHQRMAWPWNMVWCRSRSFKMARFDRPCTTFYWSAIVTIAPSCTVFELFDAE